MPGPAAEPTSPSQADREHARHTHLNIMLNSLRASSVTPVVFLEGKNRIRDWPSAPHSR